MRAGLVGLGNVNQIDHRVITLEHVVLAGGGVFLDHQGDLEDDGIVKFAQVKASQLLDLLKTVDQRVAVDEQLARGLGDVQAVLKEHIDGKEGLLIERINGVFLKDLGQENLAQRRRKLIDQTADAEIFVVDDGFWVTTMRIM